MNKKRIIGLFIIAIGIFLIGLSFYARWDTDYKNIKAIDNFERIIEKNTSSENKQNNESENKEFKKIDFSDGVGILNIPKIDLRVIIKDGTDMKTLRHAVGHFKDTPMPWESGNSAIAGHRQYTYGEFFNRVDEIENGDLIVIETLYGKINYKVAKKEVIEATQMEVLDNTDNDCLTIITCVKGGKERVALLAVKTGVDEY